MHGHEVYISGINAVTKLLHDAELSRQIVADQPATASDGMPVIASQTSLNMYGHEFVHTARIDCLRVLVR